jgi:branched-chain amino acid transport system ATP-binding protein
MLSLESLCLDYGSFRALDGISLRAGQGELVVLLGANGAGKSSIFLTASGLRRPAAGRMRFKEHDLATMKPGAVVRAGLVQCPEGRKLFPRMTVLQNLLMGAYVHRADQAGTRRLLDTVFEIFPPVFEKKSLPAGALSGGQQQMVAIGRALMGRPQLLMLDEPSLGLAPLVVQQVFQAIRRIHAGGTTVLLAEQNAHAALAIADRGYVIERGRVVLEGSREALLGNPAIRQAYLGA